MGRPPPEPSLFCFLTAIFVRAGQSDLRRNCRALGVGILYAGAAQFNDQPVLHAGHAFAEPVARWPFFLYPVAGYGKPAAVFRLGGGRVTSAFDQTAERDSRRTSGRAGLRAFRSTDLSASGLVLVRGAGSGAVTILVLACGK